MPLTIEKLKQHKFFNRTDNNLQALANSTETCIETIKNKISFYNNKLIEYEKELRVLKQIISYRKRNKITVEDNIIYKK